MFSTCKVRLTLHSRYRAISAFSIGGPIGSDTESDAESDDSSFHPWADDADDDRYSSDEDDSEDDYGESEYNVPQGQSTICRNSSSKW
jgi:hypothetical protein